MPQRLRSSYFLKNEAKFALAHCRARSTFEFQKTGWCKLKHLLSCCKKVKKFKNRIMHGEVTAKLRTKVDSSLGDLGGSPFAHRLELNPMRLRGRKKLFLKANI